MAVVLGLRFQGIEQRLTGRWLPWCPFGKGLSAWMLSAVPAAANDELWNLDRRYYHYSLFIQGSGLFFYVYVT